MWNTWGIKFNKGSVGAMLAHCVLKQQNLPWKKNTNNWQTVLQFKQVQTLSTSMIFPRTKIEEGSWISYIANFY